MSVRVTTDVDAAAATITEQLYQMDARFAENDSRDVSKALATYLRTMHRGHYRDAAGSLPAPEVSWPRTALAYAMQWYLLPSLPHGVFLVRRRAACVTS